MHQETLRRRWEKMRPQHLRAYGILTLATLSLLLAPDNQAHSQCVGQYCDFPVSNTQTDLLPEDTKLITSQKPIEIIAYGAPNSNGIIGLSGPDALENYHDFCRGLAQEFALDQPFTCSVDAITLSGNGFNFAIQELAEAVIDNGGNVYIHFHPPGDWEEQKIIQAAVNIFSGQPVFEDDPESVILTKEFLAQHTNQIGISYDPEPKFYQHRQSQVSTELVNAIIDAYYQNISRFTDKPLDPLVYELGGGTYFFDPQNLHPQATVILSNFANAGDPEQNALTKAFAAGLLNQDYPNHDMYCMFFRGDFLTKPTSDAFGSEQTAKFLKGHYIGQLATKVGDRVSPFECDGVVEQ